MTREPLVYEDVVKRFASEGAAMIGENIRQRYGGKAYESGRPLEPGFIPLGGRPRITFVTWYPNASDLKRDPNYNQLRNNFANWGDRGDTESYRAAYEDWLASLPLIDFYRNNMLPELMAVDVSPREIAWLPMVKAPHPARSDPHPDVVEKDKDALWLQLKLLQPAVVVVHGAKAWATLGERIKEVYVRVLPQKILYVASAAKIKNVVAEVTPRLRRYLDETMPTSK